MQLARPPAPRSAREGSETSEYVRVCARVWLAFGTAADAAGSRADWSESRDSVRVPSESCLFSRRSASVDIGRVGGGRILFVVDVVVVAAVVVAVAVAVVVFVVRARPARAASSRARKLAARPTRRLFGVARARLPPACAAAAAADHCARRRLRAPRFWRCARVANVPRRSLLAHSGELASKQTKTNERRRLHARVRACVRARSRTVRRLARAQNWREIQINSNSRAARATIKLIARPIASLAARAARPQPKTATTTTKPTVGRLHCDFRACQFASGLWSRLWSARNCVPVYARPILARQTR